MPYWIPNCSIQCRDLSRYLIELFTETFARLFTIFIFKFDFFLSIEKQDDEIASTTDMAKVAQKFVELEKDITDTVRQFENCSELNRKTSYEVQLKRQALEAFLETIKMFEEQMKLQERFQKEAQPHEIST